MLIAQVKSSDMIKALQKTTVPEWRAETIESFSGECLGLQLRVANSVTTRAPCGQDSGYQVSGDLVCNWASLVFQAAMVPICNCAINLQRTEDSKTAGEAMTQPNVRLPPLKEGRLPKLLGAPLGCRLAQGNLQQGDFVMLLDGGRDIQASLLGAVKGPGSESITKSKNVLFLVHDERLGRDYLDFRRKEI